MSKNTNFYKNKIGLKLDCFKACFYCSSWTQGYQIEITGLLGLGKGPNVPLNKGEYPAFEDFEYHWYRIYAEV